jgi:hypothetical protein
VTASGGGPTNIDGAPAVRRRGIAWDLRVLGG